MPCPLPDRDAELLLQGGQVAVMVWRGRQMLLVAYAKVARTQAGVTAVRYDVGTLSIMLRKLAHPVFAEITPIARRKTRKVFVPRSPQCLEGLFGSVPVLSPVLRSPFVDIGEDRAAAASEDLLPCGFAVVNWL